MLGRCAEGRGKESVLGGAAWEDSQGFTVG